MLWFVVSLALYEFNLGAVGDNIAGGIQYNSSTRYFDIGVECPGSCGLVVAGCR